MEQLNRIELKGTIGNAHPTKVGVSVCVRFSVATNYVYRDMDGNPIIETTWHDCTLFTDSDTAETIKKGRFIHLLGRLRNQRYTDCDGVEKHNIDILVYKVLSIQEIEHGCYPQFQRAEQ